MGDQRISVRTLPDGYKVHHHPPDDRHPEGKQVLVPGQSRMRAKLLEAHPENMAALAAKHEHHHRKVARRRESYHAHPRVPPSKRFF